MTPTTRSCRRGRRLLPRAPFDALLAGLCAIAVPAGGWSQSPPPADTIRLASGTVLVGHITSVTSAKVHIRVDAVGDLAVDSSAILPAVMPPVTPHVAPPPAAARRSPWSGTFSASGSYVSEVVPGLVGSTLGTQVSAGVARATRAGGVTLDGTLGYWRVAPSVAAMNQWSLTFGWRHEVAPKFPVLARSIVEVNRVQQLRYRTTTLAGVGYTFVKSPTVTLNAAPGLGFVKSEQTALGRVTSFAAGKLPGVEGAAWGAHEMLVVQLTPTLGLQQNALWLRGFTRTPYTQLQLDARLTAMVMKHLGLLIVFTQQHDSSMPAPVSTIIRTLNPGVQLVF
jgi:hypothetical protein